MKESHGGNKNNGFALTAHLIRSRLHLLNGSYNFHGIHLENLIFGLPGRPEVILFDIRKQK
jgi:hypothetical protein